MIGIDKRKWRTSMLRLGGKKWVGEGQRRIVGIFRNQRGGIWMPRRLKYAHHGRISTMALIQRRQMDFHRYRCWIDVHLHVLHRAQCPSLQSMAPLLIGPVINCQPGHSFIHADHVQQFQVGHRCQTSSQIFPPLLSQREPLLFTRTLITT